MELSLESGLDTGLLITFVPDPINQTRRPALVVGPHGDAIDTTSRKPGEDFEMKIRRSLLIEAGWRCFLALRSTCGVVVVLVVFRGCAIRARIPLE